MAARSRSYGVETAHATAVAACKYRTHETAHPAFEQPKRMQTNVPWAEITSTTLQTQHLLRCNIRGQVCRFKISRSRRTLFMCSNDSSEVDLMYEGEICPGQAFCSQRYSGTNAALQNGKTPLRVKWDRMQSKLKQLVGCKCGSQQILPKIRRPSSSHAEKPHDTLFA